MRSGWAAWANAGTFGQTSPHEPRPSKTPPVRRRGASSLTPGGDHLQVVCGPHCGAVLRAVVALDQRDQVSLQSSLPTLVERPEGLVQRPVVAAHELDVVPGRPKAPHEAAPPRLQ